VGRRKNPLHPFAVVTVVRKGVVYAKFLARDTPRSSAGKIGKPCKENEKNFFFTWKDDERASIRFNCELTVYSSEKCQMANTSEVSYEFN
jgi:hypothetical protein